MSDKEKIITYIDKLLEKYPKNYYLLMVAEFIDSLQKEPISEDLEKASLMHFKDVMEYEIKTGHKMAHITSFKAGAKWQKENLWKPADGKDLPEIDREVVAFQEAFPTDVDVPSLLKVVIAHRPNPKGYDGKSVTTGKVEHYTPMTYDKGEWNIPNVKWWLDCSIPKEIEL